MKKYLVFQKLDVFKWISRFPVFLAKLQKYVALKIRSGACLPALFWYGLNEQPKAERVYNGRINVNRMSSPDDWLIFVLRRRKQKREWSSSPSLRSSICSWWGSCTTHRPTKTSRSMTGKEKKQADALKIVFEVRLLVNYCAERTLITPRHTMRR